MRGVKPVFLLANLPEILLNVGRQHHVCGNIQVMVVAQRLAAKRIPNFLRMRVIFVCYVYACQARIKLIFWRQSGFIKPFLPLGEI